MKKIFLIASVVQILLLLPGCEPAEKVETEEQKLQAADSLDKKYVAAFNKGSWKAIMETYWNSDDLKSNSLMTTGGSNFINWKKSQEDWFNSFDVIKGATIRFMDSKNKVEGGLVLGWGDWELKDSSGTSKGRGNYFNIKAKKDNKWVYIMDNFAESGSRLKLIDRLN